MRVTSEVDVGMHLIGKEANTDARPNDEANTQEIERVKNGSYKKNVFREDQAKQNMVFSKESSRAVFETDNVKLVELQNSSIQCPTCLHHVFEGTLLFKSGKLIKPNQDVMNRTKEAFELLKAPYYRTSPIPTRGSKCGPNLWQQHYHLNLGQMAKR